MLTFTFLPYWCVWRVCRWITGLVGRCIVMFLRVSYVFVCVCVCVFVCVLFLAQINLPQQPPPPPCACRASALCSQGLGWLCCALLYNEVLLVFCYAVVCGSVLCY